MRFSRNIFAAIAATLLLVTAAPLGAAKAEPYVLMDIASGRILAEEDATKRWYPASLTKLMTAYTVLRAVEKGYIRMDSPVVISKSATREPPSKIGFPAGTVLTFEEALKIIMVKSANDISTSIAESLAGSTYGFAALMNEEAKRLGMTGSNFVNAHGLFATGQYTTARDMAILTRALRTEFARYDWLYRIDGLTVGEKRYPNYNYLLGRFPGADGMKTGYVCESGFNLIATATRNQRTLAAVVLGAPGQVERAALAATLLEKGFANETEQTAMPVAMYTQRPEDTEPTNLRPTVCSPEVVKTRIDRGDDENVLINASQFVSARASEPVFQEVRFGASGPASTAPKYADVPLPTPRPNYTPPAQPVAAEAAQGG
ncbi:D-alanyl-D-alanine carboxypeptidase family protein [Nitratireductor basaltis]|uniref:Peptidase S11, D-alanyl-D-alanine carboxypeptidase 1 n=1 Tax=Nitratireductor basaltis TaxID=472175 RepID=A0A084U7J8_9HYPH|nr:D-alanyl-D-alanine carboxypeptidase family protein [Nitratireductor basaltis]KFB08934.1 Peptidase S11, D-alanyl-D-alanine carboxypeptidase 1 [Nitratireductor basaltis]